MDQIFRIFDKDGDGSIDFRVSKMWQLKSDGVDQDWSKFDQCTLGKSLYKFPGKETRHELFPAPMLVSDWCETIEIWSLDSVWKWKFATSVETFPDLILEMLYKAIKNKKVKVKLPDNTEKDETTQTSNMRNSKC